MEFTWDFDQIATVVHPDFDGLIVSLRWHLRCHDGEVMAADYGVVNLGPPNDIEFVPEHRVSRERATRWVTDALASTDMNVPARKARLAAIVEEKRRRLANKDPAAQSR
jgi:hypothetical protein